MITDQVGKDAITADVMRRLEGLGSILHAIRQDRDLYTPGPFLVTETAAVQV